ncbi:hypothetical protein Kpol_1055p56 [Vanderwaltozyma polyspora DSM 70294]|uniref:Uncharacterized protein n=1 Tax=Vanderwaltozyma polyspora (strain ATCC 22028 / DSM 70294 / BCRC 21397 / CBS 2163 / NBRC 10782 / NRRL Y-8283 / UCD 57-17) TaxID=436907 RepID=A7TGC9_VANPO|nr:uncharacterized protein Kpol_1055p56 [Vanderwaltozyma polyspora DSM 70294]EDO18699.1 hypothetical protein Kpol_1055p56 [Vanderwaltozyma polyspora DSM 70294]
MVSLLGRRAWLVVCLICYLAATIMTIVAISGSTNNTSSSRNIYIGSADISHINVSKVVPQVAPLLTVLGTAVTAPNATLDSVFGALKNIADTEALTPLLMLLSTASNVSATLQSLTALAPLAVQGNSTLVSTQIANVQGLLNLSTSANETLMGLEELIQTTLSSNSTESAMAQQTALTLLAQSNNVTGSTEALLGLNSLNSTEKQLLSPVFEIVNNSTNQTVTFGAFAVLMNTTIPQGFQSALESVTDMSSLNATLALLSSGAPSDLKPAVAALGALVGVSRTPLDTLTVLAGLYSRGLTTASWAKASFASLTELLTYAKNTTEVLVAVESLSAITDSTSTTNELQALEMILSSSSDPSKTLSYLIQLASVLTSDTSLTQYIPYLFTLIAASSDPIVTIDSLIIVVEWASQNAATFAPLIAILAEAASVEPISSEEFMNITPALLEYLGIPFSFRLSFFSLCKEFGNHTQQCTHMHPVQNFDFRNIIYDALLESEFDPYLKALNITADDLYLEGRLLRREHEYVPSIKATLAMSILFFLTSFVAMFIMGWLMFKPYHSNLTWLCINIYCCFVSIFAGLSATIPSAIVGIIKRGSAYDRYNVIFKHGSAYYGLIWTSFCIVFLSGVSIIALWWLSRGGDTYSESGVGYYDDEKMPPNVNVNSNDESSSTASDGNNEKVNTNAQQNVVTEH